MAIEICPLAMDWGSWADWAAVLVALAGTGAVVLLGLRTNALGKAANEIAQEAKRAADAADNERARIAKAERELLLIYLSGEIAGAISRLRRLKIDVNDDAFCQEVAVDEVAARKMLSRLDGEVFPRTNACLNRMHLVGNPEAAKLVRVMGTLRALADTIPPAGIWSDEIGRMHLVALRGLLNVLLPDLEQVGDACRRAVADSGIPIGGISEKEFRDALSMAAAGDAIR